MNNLNQVSSDSKLREIIENARRQNLEIPPISLSGGDLAKTLGITSSPPEKPLKEYTEFKCDIGSALLDGALFWFVAHLTCWKGRQKKFSGDFLSIMNAAWLGDLNLAPKAHPGDEKLDAIQGHLNSREAREFKKRAYSGSHLPHPAVKTRKIVSESFDFSAPTNVYLDGVLTAKVRQLSIRIEPAALTLLI